MVKERREIKDLRMNKTVDKTLIHKVSACISFINKTDFKPSKTIELWNAMYTMVYGMKPKGWNHLLKHSFQEMLWERFKTLFYSAWLHNGMPGYNPYTATEISVNPRPTLDLMMNKIKDKDILYKVAACISNLTGKPIELIPESIWTEMFEATYHKKPASWKKINNPYTRGYLWQKFEFYYYQKWVEKGMPGYIAPVRVPAKHTNKRSIPGWARIRYEVICERGRRCELCGAKPSADNDISLHVDHIIPFSVNPALGAEKSNLRVLCQNCNIGRSNKPFRVA